MLEGYPIGKVENNYLLQTWRNWTRGVFVGLLRLPTTTNPEMETELRVVSLILLDASLAGTIRAARRRRHKRTQIKLSVIKQLVN